jgi:hypothetical protein
MEPRGIAMFDQIIPISASQGGGLKITRQVILTIILFIWIMLLLAVLPPLASPPVQACADDLGAAQDAEESQSLEPDTPIERELTGGRSHFYRIALTSGQYLQIAVSQRRCVRQVSK